MSLEREISATEAKMRFGEILDLVVHGQQTAIITKHGKPVAKMVVYKNTPSHNEEDLPEWYTEIREYKKRVGKWQKKHGVKQKISDVDLIKQIRKEEDRRLIQ